jgi:subtilisin family serine protease
VNCARCAHTALLLLCLLAALPAFAAENERPNLGVPETRQQVVEQLMLESRGAKGAAWVLAQRQGWSPKGQVNGRLFELMAIDNGRVYTYVTTNVNAAISTGVNLIRNVSPYNLNGAGLTAGIWDGGLVRASHQEFTGRVSPMDGGTVEDHSTHVAGTIGAAGIVPAAEGMAPSVDIHSYEWTDDVAEMTSRAMSYPGEPGTIQFSNHSYSYIAGWFWDGASYWWYGTWGDRESDYFGLYDTYTRDWDVLCYNAPYFLPFKAASNDRSDDAPPDGTWFYYYMNGWKPKRYDSSKHPYDDGWDNGGFDTIPFVGNAKNIMTVGAVNDAVSGGTRSLGNATMTSFSSWGPTDDGRIKPDIVANGVQLYSSTAGSDSSYDSYSGTSMATPNAMGSAALLVEYYGNLFPGEYMRASTIKGLIIHTADDLGRPGPDYSFGWGLMNAKAAADFIERQHAEPTVNRMLEDVLDGSNPARSYEFTWDGSSPIRATLCWTDPPASAVTGLDNPSPRLVNDLDLRIVGPGGGTTYYPYVLDPSNPLANATTGDNVLDNVEQVFILSPDTPGTYTVQVSHKGTLTDGEQYFSLLISGAASPIQGATVLSITRSGADPAWVEMTWTSGPTFTLYWTGDPPGGPQTWNAVDGSALGDVVDNGDTTWTWTDKGTDPDMGGLAPADVEKRFYRVGAD